MGIYCRAQGALLNALCRKSQNGDICIHVADSLCHRAETNNIEKQLNSNKFL